MTVRIDCHVCGDPLTLRALKARLDRCPNCRPAVCLGCRRTFPKSKLRKSRCPTCVTVAKLAGKPAKQQRKMSPLEVKYRARQTRWRREAEEASRKRAEERRRADPERKKPKRRLFVIEVSGGLPGQNRRRH